MLQWDSYRDCWRGLLNDFYVYLRCPNLSCTVYNGMGDCISNVYSIEGTLSKPTKKSYKDILNNIMLGGYNFLLYATDLIKQADNDLNRLKETNKLLTVIHTLYSTVSESATISDGLFGIKLSRRDRHWGVKIRDNKDSLVFMHGYDQSDNQYTPEALLKTLIDTANKLYPLVSGLSKLEDRHFAKPVTGGYTNG